MAVVAVVAVVAIMAYVEQKSIVNADCGKSVSSTVTNCTLRVGCAYQKFNYHFGKHQTPEAELLTATKIAQRACEHAIFPT